MRSGLIVIPLPAGSSLMRYTACRLSLSYTTASARTGMGAAVHFVSSSDGSCVGMVVEHNGMPAVGRVGMAAAPGRLEDDTIVGRAHSA
jgi:hypothetical protein